MSWERKCVGARGRKDEKKKKKLCMMAFSYSGERCHNLNKVCVCFYIFNDAFNVHLLAVLSDGTKKTEEFAFVLFLILELLCRTECYKSRCDYFGWIIVAAEWFGYESVFGEEVVGQEFITVHGRSLLLMTSWCVCWK